MDDLAYERILKRVGTVLIVVGMLDIGLMIYCIIHRIAYASSFNIFAVIAGVFLVRGSRRAAGRVLWAATFFLTALGFMLVAWPLFVPPGLVLAALRLYPLESARSVAFLTFALGLLYWVVQQLGKGPVLPMEDLLGLTMSFRGACISGLILVAAAVLAVGIGLNGKDARRAKEVAAAQLGPGYEYQVTSFNWSEGTNGSEFSATVTAWNNREIRQVPVHWKER